MEVYRTLSFFGLCMEGFLTKFDVITKANRFSQAQTPFQTKKDKLGGLNAAVGLSFARQAIARITWHAANFVGGSPSSCYMT